AGGEEFPCAFFGRAAFPDGRNFYVELALDVIGEIALFDAVEYFERGVRVSRLTEGVGSQVREYDAVHLRKPGRLTGDLDSPLVVARVVGGVGEAVNQHRVV